MAELIYRDKCQERIFRFAKRLEDLGMPDRAKAVRAVAKGIKLEKTVDAVEVVHGYWHIDDCDSGDPYEYAAFIEVHCSECGYELGAESGQYEWTYGDPFPLNYCPNCGAHMDLEE